MLEAPSAANAVARGKVFAPELPIAPLNAFNTNNRIHQYLIDHIPPEAWKATTPNGKGRIIPAIVAHMHNVGVMRLEVRAKGNKIPAQLDRTKVTRSQALHALERSRHAARQFGHPLPQKAMFGMWE
jgi:hypothetical protein